MREIKVVVRPLEEDFSEIAEAFRRIERGEELESSAARRSSSKASTFSERFWEMMQ